MTLFSRVLLFLKKKSFSIAVSSLYFYICKSHFCLPYIYTTLKSTIFCPKKFIIMETLREEAPSSYLMKLVGFSEVKFSHQPYESADFDAAGHKWYCQPNLRSHIYLITLMYDFFMCDLS